MALNKHYILAAGGTGGHLFPAQAVASALLAHGHQVTLLTDPRSAGYGNGFAGVACVTLPLHKSGSGLVTKIRSLLSILQSLRVALRYLKQSRPAAVIGFGGYPSLPTMLAAQWLGIPTCIHEQNKKMGKANRLLSKRANAVATSFPEVVGFVPQPQQQVTLTGNPVRPAIAALAGMPYTLPAENQKFRLLIFGGSQGARIFSTVVPEAIALLPETLRNHLSLVQQARQEDLVSVVQRYSDLRIVAEVKPFFDDMPERLQATHLVICRAGASTVAELLMVGRPAIYAPYPHAAENHQQDNAAFVVQHHAGWLMPDAEMTPQNLAALLEKLLSEPALMTQAAAAASTLAETNAAQRIAQLLEALG